MAKPLRVVKADGEVGVAAASRRSRRDLLAALLENITSEIDDGVPARDLASLSLRAMKIAEELEALDSVVKETHVAAAAATADEPWTAS